MKKSFNQIISIIKTNFSLDEYGNEDWWDEKLNHLGLGKIVEIETSGFYNDTKWYSVRHFVDHDVYIKSEGLYSSYGGLEISEYGFEVLPTEVSVIQYLAAPIIVDDYDRVLTGEELIEKLITTISFDEFGDSYDSIIADIIGENKLVIVFGNHEGAGEIAYVIRHFMKHDVYIKLNGFYSSYNGCKWENYEIVRPAQKTITEYI